MGTIHVTCVEQVEVTDLVFMLCALLGRIWGWLWSACGAGGWCVNLRGRLKRSARAVQLFGRLAVLETHTLRY